MQAEAEQIGVDPVLAPLGAQGCKRNNAEQDDGESHQYQQENGPAEYQHDRDL